MKEGDKYECQHNEDEACIEDEDGWGTCGDKVSECVSLGIAKKIEMVTIKCPKCGRLQDTTAITYRAVEAAIKAGRMHPYTCGGGGGPCGHVEMEEVK